MITQLAMYGGTPARTKPFPYSMTTGEEEVQAASAVIRTGLLSGFLGSPAPEFFGGPRVLELERRWSEKFEIEHSVSCNSATSALIMAVGALEIGPGDEVLVTPYTMSATATAILFYGGIPVFCDIEPEYFCLDPKKLEAKVTSKTKAIITVDIHGLSSDMNAINLFARKHRLKVIVDCSQAPGAKYENSYAGTLGDIGIYSLNRHKAIQCGEGGIAVTRDRELALRMQLIRNHGENMSDYPPYSPKSLVNILGFNFRMTEVEAAIAIEQLKKLDSFNHRRQELVGYLNSKLSAFPGIQVPMVRPNCTHVYYLQALLFDESRIGVSRDRFVEAVKAEGIPLKSGYLRPLYLEPLYQRRIAMGDQGFPFSLDSTDHASSRYQKGTCPVAEDLFERKTVLNPFVYSPLNTEDMDDIIAAIEKVYENRFNLN